MFICCIDFERIRGSIISKAERDQRTLVTSWGLSQEREEKGERREGVAGWRSLRVERELRVWEISMQLEEVKVVRSRQRL